MGFWPTALELFICIKFRIHHSKEEVKFYKIPCNKNFGCGGCGARDF